jgi:NAD(P)-dependent dehydrogenase (short-subunit alcohol dehydrogenase family)
LIDSTGRVILVSGTSRGIGRAIAEKLLQSGFTVSAGLRDPRQAPAHQRLIAFPYDARQPGAADDWVQATLRAAGRIDGLVNAAGLSLRMPLLGSDEDALFGALDQMMLVNVKAPMAMIRAAWPYLVACGEGRVVNVSSLSGKRVRNENIAYAMTKFALMALNQEVRRLGFSHGIRSTALCPGFVNTDMTRDVNTVPRDQMSQLPDLAELVDVVMRLPNTAAVSELLVNWRHEDLL